MLGQSTSQCKEVPGAYTVLAVSAQMRIKSAVLTVTELCKKCWFREILLPWENGSIRNVLSQLMEMWLLVASTLEKKQIACVRSLTGSNLDITVMFRTADPAVCCSPGRLDETLVAAGWYSICLAATRRDLQLYNFWFSVTFRRVHLKNCQDGQTD